MTRQLIQPGDRVAWNGNETIKGFVKAIAISDYPFLIQWESGREDWYSHEAIRKEITPKIEDFLDKTKEITLADLATGHNADYLLRNTIEELGEYASAVTVNAGIKNKELKETPRQEAVDVIICALSLFYAAGGTNEELTEYGLLKLQKWASRITVLETTNAKVSSTPKTT